MSIYASPNTYLTPHTNGNLGAWVQTGASYNSGQQPGCSGDVYPWIKISWTQTSGHAAPQMHAYKTPQSHPYKRAAFSKLHVLAGRDNKRERSFQSLNLFLSLEFSEFQSRIQCPWTPFPNRTSLPKSSHPGIKEKPPHLTPDRKRLQILTLIFACCVLGQVTWHLWITWMFC